MYQGFPKKCPDSLQICRYYAVIQQKSGTTADEVTHLYSIRSKNCGLLTENTDSPKSSKNLNVVGYDGGMHVEF